MTRVLMTYTLLLGVGVGSAAAKDKPEVARVPFSFIVANQTLPAGRYDVVQVKGTSPVFVLQNEKGDSIFVHLGSHGPRNAAAPSIEFACHQHDCVLASIRPASGSVTYRLGPGLLEGGRQPIITIQLEDQ